VTAVYSFQRQLEQGQEGEKFLDGFFSPDWRIEAATPVQQRQGIDRVFTHRANGRALTVEYKTDVKAGMTGNAFVETESVSAGHKPGWALSSRADYLVYYIPEPATVYIIRMVDLRRQLPIWKARHRTRQVSNVGYVTTGILVPLSELERIAIEVV
jgi:hypothetical protein